MSQPKSIKIIIAGASIAGLSSLVRLLTSKSVLPLEIIVIEPKTSFEFTPTTWDFLPKGSDFWDIPILNQNHTLESLDQDRYTQCIEQINEKFSSTFFPYTHSQLFAAPNVKLYHGYINAINKNTITFVPTLNAKQPSPLPSIQEQELINANLNLTTTITTTTTNLNLTTTPTAATITTTNLNLTTPTTNLTPTSDIISTNTTSSVLNDGDNTNIATLNNGDNTNIAALNNGDIIDQSNNDDNDDNDDDDDNDDNDDDDGSLTSITNITNDDNSSLTSITNTTNTNDNTILPQYTLPYHILINATGSSSIQPIKPISQYYSCEELLTKLTPLNTNFTSTLTNLINFFRYNDLSLLQSTAQTFHMSLQSLLYLKQQHIIFLIQHYMPGVVVNQHNYIILRTIVLLCFFLSTYPAQLYSLLCKYNVNNDDIIEIIKQKYEVNYVDSTMLRYIELIAVREMLLYTNTPTNVQFTEDTMGENVTKGEDDENGNSQVGKIHQKMVNSLPQSAQLPQLHQLPQIEVINCIGGGATGVELFGDILDVYYNEYKGDNSAGLNNNNGNDVVVGKENKNRKKVEFHMWSASKVMFGFPQSVADYTKKHFTTTYTDVADVNIHEEVFWQPDEPLKQCEEKNRKKNCKKNCGENCIENCEKVENCSENCSENHPEIQLGSIISLFAFGIQRSQFASQTNDYLMCPESVKSIGKFVQYCTKNDKNIEKKNLPISDSSLESKQIDEISINTNTFGLVNFTPEFILGNIPGMIFTIGDAYVRPGVPPNARVAHAAANFAIDNTIIYINIFINQLIHNCQEFCKQFIFPLVHHDNEKNHDKNDKKYMVENDQNNYQEILLPFFQNFMYLYKAPVDGQFVMCHLGQFGGIMSSPTMNMLRYLPIIGMTCQSQKIITRNLIMKVFKDHPSSWAPTQWNIIEFFASTMEMFF